MKKSHLSINLIISMMAASAALLSAEAMASGYAIRETSTSLLGNSYAGSSTADEDASSMHYNPATLSMIDDSSIYVAGTGIFPDIKAHDINGEMSFAPLPSVPIAGSSSASGIGEAAFVPAGYFAWNVDEDWKLGLAITSPWGLATEYDNDWVGRYHGVYTKVETVNINPILSFRVNKQLSLAAGFQAQYINAKLKQDGYDFIFEPEAGFVGYADVPTKVEGNDWGYGYNLGLLYEFTKHTRLGVGYQSKINHKIEGDASVSQIVHADEPGFPIVEAGKLFNADASTEITTPEQVNLGVSHDIDKHWSVMGDIQWTRWDRFEELRIEIDSPTGEVSSVTKEEWKNTWFYAVGLNYKPNKKWVFRSGAAYDQSPIRSEFRNPTIPDSDRVLLSLGAGYNFTDNIRLDAGYMYVFFKDVSVEIPLDSADPTSTSLNADYKGHANIVSLGLNWLF